MLHGKRAALPLQGGYAVWLFFAAEAGVPGAWRGFAALGVIFLLTLRTVSDRQDAPQKGAASWEYACLTMAIVSAACAVTYHPMAWILSCVATLVHRRLNEVGQRGLLQAIPVMTLAVATYPLETLLPPGADLAVQTFTAQIAQYVVTVTGLPVTCIEDAIAPTLVGPDGLMVHVTALCAGTSTLIVLSTLGLILAEAFLTDLGDKLLCMALAPALGLFGNVLRIALSTHAANAWAADRAVWSIAHDGIGYLTFIGIYAALFSAIRRLRKSVTLTATSRASGTSVASPSATNGVM